MTDVFQVAGTTFRFPSVPPDGGRGAELLTESRDSVLAAARKVRPAKTHYTPPRPAKVKPGNGTFEPKPGGPGWPVYVTLVDLDHKTPSIDVRGCVMFPAPGPHMVWVSLWDGKMPVGAYLDGDMTHCTVHVPASQILWHTHLAEAA
jgi:hypothetical protein